MATNVPPSQGRMMTSTMPMMTSGMLAVRRCAGVRERMRARAWSPVQARYASVVTMTVTMAPPTVRPSEANDRAGQVAVVTEVAAHHALPRQPREETHEDEHRQVEDDEVPRVPG